jgi:hypothetical protein
VGKYPGVRRYRRVDSVSSANETRAVNSPEVKEPGDVQEEGASRFWAAKSRRVQGRARARRKQRLCKRKAAREQTGAIQEDTTGRRVKERSEQSLWRLCAAGIRRKRKRCSGRALQSSLAGLRAAGSQPA